MAATDTIPDAPGPDGPRLLLLDRGKIVASYPLSAQRSTIGRVPENAICLDDPLASRIHATVTLRDGEAILEDLGSANPTRVNEQPISEWRLRSGDVIRIGRSVLIYLAATARAPEHSETFGSVVARQEGGGTIKLPLTGQPFLIGRIEQANVQLQGELIRDCHALIAARAGTADLILLTAQPLRALPLAPDAEIGCGTVTLLCHLNPVHEPQEASSDEDVLIVHPDADEQPLIVYPVADDDPTKPVKPALSAVEGPAPNATDQPAAAAKPPKPPEPKPAPSIHMDLRCGTVTLMNLLRKDAQRAERDEDDSNLTASGDVPDEEASLEPETKGGLKLTITKGSGVGQTFSVGKGRCIIGTDVLCRVRLTGAGIAPRHVAIFTRVGKIVAEDLGSPSGTLMNGQSIRSRPLATGDTIRIGDCELLVHI